MHQKGKFLLFDFSEFAAWLDDLEVNRTVRLIQNHHTWQPDYAAFQKLPDHFHWMESMENYQKQNGFAEIAQQLTTFPDGKIAVGRSFDTIPAGIKGANQYGVCIEHLGNFDAGADAMTPAQIDVIVMLNAALCRKFSLEIDTNGIVYHHWWDIVTGLRWATAGEASQRTNGSGTVKSCPGTNFFGGNSLQACESNFIPLIKSAMLTYTTI
jgi:hypothetical protein